MGYTGINLGNVKMSNRSSILKLLNDCGAMSRKDIAIELGADSGNRDIDLHGAYFGRDSL